MIRTRKMGGFFKRSHSIFLSIKWPGGIFYEGKWSLKHNLYGPTSTHPCQHPPLVLQCLCTTIGVVDFSQAAGDILVTCPAQSLQKLMSLSITRESNWL